MDKERFGTLIKTRRKEKNLNQQKLADLLHVSVTTVSKWETGVNLPDVMTLEKLARELEIPLPELFDLEDSADKASSSSRPGTEREPSVQPGTPGAYDTPDSLPKLPPGDFPTKPKAKCSKLIAFILSLILIGIIIIGYQILTKKNGTFSPEICEEYQGEYEGENAYYIIMKYKEMPTTDALLAHGDVIRREYEPHFLTSDLIVIIYTSDYGNFKENGFDDVNDCFTILYPY